MLREEYKNLLITYVEEKIRLGYVPFVKVHELEDFLWFYYANKTDCNGLTITIDKRILMAALKDLDSIFKKSADGRVYFVSYAIDSCLGEKNAWDVLIIDQFLEGFPKRNIGTGECREEYYNLGLNVAALFLPAIWDGYLSNLANGEFSDYSLPILLEDNERQEFNRMRNKSSQFLQVVAKRIALCCVRDFHFRMNSKQDYIFAHANYKAVMDGFEDFLAYAHNYLGPVNFSFDFVTSEVCEEKTVPVWKASGDELVSKPYLLIRQRPAINKNSRRLVEALVKE